MLNNMKEHFAEIGSSMQEKEREEAILAAACNQDWNTVLTMVEEPERLMDRDAAELCLKYALKSAPVAVFDRLLDLLPKGDYVGSAIVKNVFRGHHVKAEGTLVLLAAAQGKTEHLQCLLAHGWDVNSASPDAACRLVKRSANMDPYHRAAVTKHEPYSARFESSLRVFQADEDEFFPSPLHRFYSGATPLAAAILCGRQACARILMDHGAWREEAPSVSRVLMMRGEEDEAFQACCEAVRTYGDGPHPMALWAVIRNVPEAELEREMQRCAYSDEAIAKAVWEMGSSYRMMPARGHWVQERVRDFRRMQILERYYPHVLRRPELVSILLRHMLTQNVFTAWNQEWEDFVFSLCGERVDLSLVLEGFVYMPPKQLKAFLLRLCERHSCFLDRDSVPPSVPVSVLQTLMQHVEFLPPMSGNSISGLTYAILNSGNLRLIRKALMTGIIPAEEPTELLLQCLGDISCATTARTLLLTIPRLPQAEDAAYVEHHKKLAHVPLFRWMPEATRKSGYEELLEEDCPEHVKRELVMRGVYDYRGKPEFDTGEGRWEVDMPLQLLCWKGRHEIVERWVRSAPRELLQTPCGIRPPWEENKLMATPLCAAAFVGQKRVVETLLALGAEAEEQKQGMPCVLRHDKEELPITPLLAAMICGHWDIAKLLVEHGARCDLTQHTVQRLWSLYNEEDLHQAVQVHLVEDSFQQKQVVALTL